MLYFFAGCPRATARNYLVTFKYFLLKNVSKVVAVSRITDEVRVTIAAQACLLLLHRKTDYFPGLLTILVYPLTYMVEEQRQIGEHLWEEGTMSRLGETGRRMGSLVLSWDAVKHGAADPSDGKNVVLHEFAHQLDLRKSRVRRSAGIGRRANSNWPGAKL